MGSFVDYAYQEEETASDDTVIEHLQRGSVCGHGSRIGDGGIAQVFQAAAAADRPSIT